MSIINLKLFIKILNCGCDHDFIAFFDIVRNYGEI